SKPAVSWVSPRCPSNGTRADGAPSRTEQRPRNSYKEKAMPLQDHMQLISTDDHLIEHPKLWSDRLPQKFLDAGPKIVEKEMPRAIHVGDGDRALEAGTKIAQVWEYEGRIYPYIGLNAVAGKKPEE